MAGSNITLLSFKFPVHQNKVDKIIVLRTVKYDHFPHKSLPGVSARNFKCSCVKKEGTLTTL